MYGKNGRAIHQIVIHQKRKSYNSSGDIFQQICLYNSNPTSGHGLRKSTTSLLQVFYRLVAKFMAKTCCTTPERTSCKHLDVNIVVVSNFMKLTNLLQLVARMSTTFLATVYSYCEQAFCWFTKCHCTHHQVLH